MGPQSRWHPTEIILLIVILSGSFTVQSAATDGELRPLKCFLQSTSSVSCNEMPVVRELPERLHKMFLNFSDVTKQAVSAGMLEILKPNVLSQLPSFFINLIPMSKLSKLSGSGVGALISSDPGNLAVLRKLSVLLTNHEMWAGFIEEVKNGIFPMESQEVLGQMLALYLPYPHNWTYHRFNETLSVGTPLMAHLPPEFLDSLDESAAPKFLFHLRSWYWHSTGFANPWHDNSWSVLRRWARLAVETNYPSNVSSWSSLDITSNSFFLDGAMADELQKLSTWQLSKDTMMANWGRLQARVLFNKIFLPGTLEEEQFLKALPLVPKLAPIDLQRFLVNETDFKQLTFTEEMSFVTAKQVVEALIAQAIVQGRMSSESSDMWKGNITSLGRFVFVLAPHLLKPYLTFPLNSSVLPEIDSDKLTPTQARYLTANSSYVNLMVPETILSLSGNLLYTLDSKSVALARVGEMSHRVRLHLLANVPLGAPVRSLAVLQKVRNSIRDSDILESMLSNKNPEQFFSLLLPKEIARAAGPMSQALWHLAEEGYAMAIKRLPHNVLSTLLSVQRRKIQNTGEGWNEDTLLKSPSSLFLLGLTCNDVNALDNTDVVAIFEKYNRERKTVRQDFPKHLQYCAQTAVINYLKTKVKLNGDGYTSANLLDHLDDSEILAIGGYVFASLPVKVMSQTPRASTMLQAVGSLSIPEILLATSGNARELANLFANELTGPDGSKLMLANLLTLGNLIHFMRASDVGRISPRDFRQFLELQNGQGVWTTVCNSLDVRAAWTRIIEAAFGPVEDWTAGVLVTLGDFLAVLPVDKLDSVPRSSWQVAADSLVTKTKYHVLLQWPGDLEPLMLYQVCGKLTDEAYLDAVTGLARRYLLAVQSLLQTVVPAGQLTRYNASKNSQESELELAPLNKPPLSPRVLNRGENSSRGTEHRGMANEENSSSNLLGASIETELTDHSEYERLRRHSDKTKEEQQQYGDVLRSKVTANHGSAETGVESAPSSPTTTYSELKVSPTTVSCEAVRASGPVAGLGLRTSDVDNMSQEELEDCLDVLGTLSLSATIKQHVWTLIRHHNLPVHLADLGSLLTEVSVKDLEQLNLDQKESGALDTLAALSAKVSNSEVLEKIVQLFSNANFNSPHPGLGAETMLALGKIACMLPVTFLRRIARSKEVFYASAALADMEACDGLCLRELAQQMLHEQVLGPIANWTSEDIRSLGVLAAGISADSWSAVKQTEFDHPLLGLQPSAIKCMETETLKAFRVDQLESLTPLAVAALSPAQMAALSDTQRFTLKQTKAMEPRSLDLVMENTSSGSPAVYIHASLLTLAAVFVLV